MRPSALTVVASLALIAPSLATADDAPPAPAASETVVRKISTRPLFLKEGGTAQQPAIFDGQGLVIDLGIDVGDHAWKKTGDIWTSSGRLLEREPLEAGNFPGLFLDELPIVIPRDRAAEKQHPDRRGCCYVAPASLAPGQMGYADDGSLYFRWPTSKSVGSGRILLPPKPNISCVTIACSHIIVRNVTAKHASNDGFNIHGAWVGVRLENVHALSNCDEGISAHDDVEMEVVDSEIAWNGSVAGGVADVNRSVTSYRNCRVHDNVGPAFRFTGKSHAVTDTLIYNQSRDFDVAEGTVLRRERIEWRKAP
jgi:hypothetical protein